MQPNESANKLPQLLIVWIPAMLAVCILMRRLSTALGWLARRRAKGAKTQPPWRPPPWLSPIAASQHQPRNVSTHHMHPSNYFYSCATQQAPPTLEIPQLRPSAPRKPGHPGH